MAGTNEGQPSFPICTVLEEEDTWMSSVHMTTSLVTTEVLMCSCWCQALCAIVFTAPLAPSPKQHWSSSHRLSSLWVAGLLLLFPRLGSHHASTTPGITKPNSYQTWSRVSLCSQHLAAWSYDSFLWLTHMISYHVFSSENLEKVFWDQDRGQDIKCIAYKIIPFFDRPFKYWLKGCLGGSVC